MRLVSKQRRYPKTRPRKSKPTNRERPSKYPTLRRCSQGREKTTVSVENKGE